MADVTAMAGRPRWQSQLTLLVALLASGVLLALVWRLLTPYTVHLGDDTEAAAAVDSTLAILGLIAGAATAGFVLLRPGPAPVLRTVTAICGSVLGGLVSWQLGDLLGTPSLRAVAAALVWPLATSGALFVGALLPGSSVRLQSRPAATLSVAQSEPSEPR